MNDADVITIEKCLGWNQFAELLKDKLAIAKCNHDALLDEKKEIEQRMHDLGRELLRTPPGDPREKEITNELSTLRSRFDGSLKLTKAILEPMGIWGSMNRWLVINKLSCDCSVLSWLTYEIPTQLGLFGVRGLPTWGKCCGNEDEDIVQ
jgi:hypothetical protein